jgi:hypothetical protein
MHKPLQSVVAFAHFEFDQEMASHAQRMLDQVDDWQEWVNQVELHALSGFVNKHIKDYQLSIPEQVKQVLIALNFRHSSAATARYKTLCLIDEAFSKSGIDYLALKGVALMPRLYQQGQLRPMRDMDLLLPKSQLMDAAQALKSVGFDLPNDQPSKYMRDVHQLPNATLDVDGFTSSVELHHNGLSREIDDNVFYPETESQLQTIQWQQLAFNGLDDVTMLHQVTRHLEGHHSGAVLKLINVMDVIGLANEVHKQGRWSELMRAYPHVINTLRCLHLHTPLPMALQQELSPLPHSKPKQVGQIMGALGPVLIDQKGVKNKLKALLLPSDWWLHLHYNVDPDRSLLWVKLVRHPFKVSDWLSRRLYSWIRRG